MAEIKVILPKMGEGVAEATIISYTKNVGEQISSGDTLVEVATDKVDSEIEAPETGIVKQIFFEKDQVVKVGETLAIIEAEGEASAAAEPEKVSEAKPEVKTVKPVVASKTLDEKASTKNSFSVGDTDKFYSPLVRSMAKEEGISLQELESIKGSGEKGRLTKNDMLAYLKTRNSKDKTASSAVEPASVPSLDGDQIIPMSRMRKLIADHMVASVATSAHVTSIMEVDVTSISVFRSKAKSDFEKKNGEKLTYTPFFIWAVSRALRDFPMINVSVDGENIIKRANINIGMAVSLPTEELIVPVIKNVDQLSLTGIAKAVNDLATRARDSKLKPDEVSGGTFSLTNFGSFSTLIGTPIINQPQVAILGIGAIQKVPAVLQVDGQDVIAIRQKMYLSLSYDHRAVDGGLGGKFLKRIADYLEQTDFENSL